MADAAVSQSYPSHANRRRQLLTTVAVALTLVLTTAAACQGQEEPKQRTVQELRELSTISNRDKLRIGIYDDFPLMSYTENGVRKGFDIEIARYIARSLGFEDDQRIEWVTLVTEDRVTALRRGRVDIVVASFSITDERARDVSFAGPYLVTTPEVLIAAEYVDEIRTIPDLRREEYVVCAAGGSTTERMLIDRAIPFQEASSPTDCRDGVLSGQYQAMVSDATILAGFRSQHPDQLTLVNMPFGIDESLGIGVPLEDEYLRDLVSYFLGKSYHQAENNLSTAWQAAYNNNLGNWLGPAEQPPPLDVPDLVDHDDKVAR
ncbi:transporter substrate-binding domain-containing protein [Solwaraspora sp. WMMB335]|uniref:transporter substrate-binding domain-containing protein n=1 Tax=Solwaraspora sp. WMMB335 TaxID=3404118 RepID=UPI003B940D02